LNSATFLLYSLKTNNKGEQPFENEEEINKKKFADYIANKLYTCDLNITNDDTVSSVVPLLGQ